MFTMSAKDRTSLAEGKTLLPAAIVSLLGNVQLGGFANHHRDAFLEERTAVGIAQLDVGLPGRSANFLAFPVISAST
jgi:hypothetical protein